MKKNAKQAMPPQGLAITMDELLRIVGQLYIERTVLERRLADGAAASIAQQIDAAVGAAGKAAAH